MALHTAMIAVQLQGIHLPSSPQLTEGWHNARVSAAGPFPKHSSEGGDRMIRSGVDGFISVIALRDGPFS